MCASGCISSIHTHTHTYIYIHVYMHVYEYVLENFDQKIATLSLNIVVAHGKIKPIYSRRIPSYIYIHI